MSDLLIWGLFARALGLTYLIFFVSLLPQIAGLNRIYPIADLLARVKMDIPAPRRYLDFPTLSWLAPGTGGLQLFALCGITAALALMIGLGSSWALLVAWLMALSLITSMGEFVSFVWDRLLIEAGFLALFLPALLPLPHLEMTDKPSSLLAFAFSFLLFRVMFGMGKFKFFGPWTQQPLFIKWFYSFQPLPTRLAYFAFRLPNSVHAISLYSMYVVEVFLPFLLFTPWAPVAALTTTLLQVGIWLSGNFGIFNLVTAVLCLPALASGGGPLHLWQVLPISVAIVGGLICLPYNTWVTNMWMYVGAYRAPIWLKLKPLLDLYRSINPLHIANAYGIFETEESHDEDLPGLEYRRVLVIEGSFDGLEWREYIPPYQTCRPESPPGHFAPHQPRIDHNLYYEAWNCRFSNINLQNPYYCGQFTWLDRLVQRLLEGDPAVESLFRHNPFPDSPPAQIRIKRYNVRFTTAHERADTGDWYVREFYEMKLEPVSLNSEVFRLPEPMDFATHHHWWRQRFGQRAYLEDNWDLEELVERRPPGRLNLGGRHFTLVGTRWYDGLYHQGLETLVVKRMSPAHRRLIRRFPELRAYLNVPNVLVVLQGRALAFGPLGETRISSAQVDELFPDKDTPCP